MRLRLLILTTMLALPAEILAQSSSIPGPPAAPPMAPPPRGSITGPPPLGAVGPAPVGPAGVPAAPPVGGMGRAVPPQPRGALRLQTPMRQRALDPGAPPINCAVR
ncbi:MAG TPA: hypothetical protein VEB21_11930 [Terriglobales bacterium]|nr:hypothetical protein [Terriglobales bacterium]